MARFTMINGRDHAEAGTPDLTAALGCEHMALQVHRLADGEREDRGVNPFAEEVHFVISGQGRLDVGEQSFDLGPLDAVRVPAGLARSVRSTGAGECWWMVMAAPTDGAAGRGGGSDQPTRLAWDDVADGTKLAPPPGYRHPWPTNTPYVSRDYTDDIGCTHLSFVVNRMDPGTAGQHHRHAESEEIHYLLEGTCDMRVGDELIHARAHDAIRVPAVEYRSFHDPGPQPCRWLVVGAPIDEFVDADLSRYLQANDWSAEDAPR